MPRRCAIPRENPPAFFRAASVRPTAARHSSARPTGMPLATIHRILQTLSAGGYVRQEPSREYALGSRLLRLNNAATRALDQVAAPHLRTLVDELGETALACVHLAPGTAPSDALAQELIDYASRELARYKLPRAVRFVDSLPRTPTGKLVKRLISL